MSINLNVLKDQIAEFIDGNIIAITPYGSRLYGTDNEKSDYDFKVIYLPRFERVLLGEKFTNYKKAYDANGGSTNPNKKIAANGVEVEFIALQTFMKDFFAGQTYALEVVYAFDQGFGEVFYTEFETLCRMLIDEYNPYNVHSMVGFAIKQTFDYVHRGKRLVSAEKLLQIVTMIWDMVSIANDASTAKKISLKSNHGSDTLFTLFVELLAKNGLSESVKPIKVNKPNSNETQNAFEFAGRVYLDSTPLPEIINMLRSRVKSYGTRTNAAAEFEIDPKSLMHALRVYDQAIELLKDGYITFPRPNAKMLKDVREVVSDTSHTSYNQMIEDAKSKLVKYEQDVKYLVETTPPEIAPTREDCNELFVSVLRFVYGLSYNQFEPNVRPQERNTKIPYVENAKETLGTIKDKIIDSTIIQKGIGRTMSVLSKLQKNT